MKSIIVKLSILTMPYRLNEMINYNVNELKKSIQNIKEKRYKVINY